MIQAVHHIRVKILINIDSYSRYMTLAFQALRNSVVWDSVHDRWRSGQIAHAYHSGPHPEQEDNEDPTHSCE